MRRTDRYIVLLTCALLVLTLALSLVNRVPDVADGLFFGVAIGLLILAQGSRVQTRA